MSNHAKYLETNGRAKARWAANNRDRINAKRRERRLRERVQRLAGKRCLNCEVLLAERLDWSPGRSYRYCRKCITEHGVQTRRHRWRRYYNRKHGITPKRKRERTKPFAAPPIKIMKDQTRTIKDDPFTGFTIKSTVGKKTSSQIYICACSNRYLKTRRGQTTCLLCIAYGGINPERRSAKVLQSAYGQPVGSAPRKRVYRRPGLRT